MVSRQALESWLSRHLTESADNTTAADSMDIGTDCDSPICILTEQSVSDIPLKEISVADIVCGHGRLDPTKAAHMKRVTKVGIRPSSPVESMLILARSDCGRPH